METEAGTLTLDPPVQSRQTYPYHTLITSVPHAEARVVAAALVAAGFTRDRFEITTAEEISWLGERIGASGAYGLLNRLRFSLGDALVAEGPARLGLLEQYALVQILIYNDQEQARARTILDQYGGHLMHYFGRWTVSDGD
ncbi:MAG TPA: hypothetical protein VFV93_09050 [Thermomicrobiales bacterium]|nr:hypothetical protein [Thermomicrobiales bacterium]